MAERRLYLAAYDVASPARLRRVHHVVLDYASGGQKSAYECWLSATEREELLARITHEMNRDEDCFCLAPITDVGNIIRRGTAVAPLDKSCVFL